MGVVKLFIVFYIEKVCGLYFDHCRLCDIARWWISSYFLYNTQSLNCSLTVSVNHYGSCKNRDWFAVTYSTPLCLGKHSGTEGWNEIQCLLVAKGV